jgi:hypothetical protein
MLGFAQQPTPAGADLVPVDPIRCWWRTTTSAVRVGETFTVVLTCAVLELDTVKVVADQTRLDATAVQLPPFEVIGGVHPPDLRTEDHRLFQYEYKLRIINDQAFGTDVKLPQMRLSYRVQTRAAAGGSIEGREQLYVLPVESIRVLSTVAADATDIRAAPPATFADIEARSFRANSRIVAGGVSFALAAVAGLAAVVQLVRRYRATKPDTKRLASDPVILREVDRELEAVQRQRDAIGWTPELAARALALFRIAAGYALSQPVSQAAAAGANGAETGAVVVTTRRWRGRSKHVIVSGTATPQTFTDVRTATSTNGRGSSDPRRLEQLQSVLIQFTRAEYGRSDHLDTAALDESMTAGRDVVRQLKSEHAWWMQKLSSIRKKSETAGSQA